MKQSIKFNRNLKPFQILLFFVAQKLFRTFTRYHMVNSSGWPTFERRKFKKFSKTAKLISYWMNVTQIVLEIAGWYAKSDPSFRILKLGRASVFLCCFFFKFTVRKNFFVIWWKLLTRRIYCVLQLLATCSFQVVVSVKFLQMLKKE